MLPPQKRADSYGIPFAPIKGETGRAIIPISRISPLRCGKVWARGAARNSYIFIILFLFSSLSFGNAPTFESEIFYCDGCLLGLVVGKDDFALRKNPSTSAPLVEGSALRKGAKLESTGEFLTRTISEGRVQVLKSTEISGRSFGKVDRLTKANYQAAPRHGAQFILDPGRQIEELQYFSEGSCLARLTDQIVEIDQCRWLEGFNPDTNPDATHFKVLKKAKTLTWIKVRSGGREGWALLDELF